MTPKDAAKFCRDLRREIGGDARVSVMLHGADMYSKGDEPALIGFISLVIAGDWIVECHADDFATLTARMRESWTAYSATARAERIKAMALAIIRITDETGSCNEAALRMARFAADEIATLGGEAAAKANEMAGRGPFSIERSANNNAAEAA